MVWRSGAETRKKVDGGNGNLRAVTWHASGITPACRVRIGEIPPLSCRDDDQSTFISG